MAIKAIEETDEIRVEHLPIVLFGAPATGKTTLAQTAENPITLDLDKGVHRCANRKRAFRFDTWQDVIDAGVQGLFRGYKTVIIDTGGRAIDMILPEVVGENSKNGFRGAPSPQGWGVIGSRFNGWMKSVLSWGLDVVILCHEKEAKGEGDTPYFRPDLAGNMAWNELHKSIDVMGRIKYEGRNRVIDFRPGENQVGKDAAAFGSVPLPDLHQQTDFLARLIASAKEKIGKASRQDAEALRAVKTYRDFLAAKPSVDALNGALPEINELPEPVKKQVKKMVADHVKARGWEYDKPAGRFVELEPAATEPEPAATEPEAREQEDAA
jgi:hypothetical protein